jgi:hypothetical protein
MTTPESSDLNQLREEVAALRRDLDNVLSLIGQHPIMRTDERDRSLDFEARGISFRLSPTFIPMTVALLDNGASIRLCDGKMVTRAKLIVDEVGARFEIRNAKGKLVVALGENKEGGGSLFVASADGKPRAGMNTLNSEGMVSVQNSAGKPMAAMRGFEEGGVFKAANAQGRSVADLGGVDECGTLMLRERTGEPMVVVTAKGERGVVSVMNEHGDDAAYLSSDENGGAIFFCDAEGEMRQRLP